MAASPRHVLSHVLYDAPTLSSQCMLYHPSTSDFLHALDMQHLFKISNNVDLSYDLLN